MATTQPDHIRIMSASGRSRGAARTEIDMRGLALTIDEPPERGGENAGPTPPETLLAALIGCTSRISHKIAEANGIEIHEMSVDVDATFDRRGVNLEREIDIPFTAIELRVDVSTGADTAAIDALRADLARFCPISKILRQSGTIITETWTVRRPRG